MPASHSLRRSRRISKQAPPLYDDAGWEQLTLMYPSTPMTDIQHVIDLRLSPASSAPSPLVQHAISFEPSKRPSHSRKKDANHIRRPRNAFMFFRSSLCQQGLVPTCVGNDHRQVSRLAGELWRNLSPAQREPFQRAATLEKSRHQLLYPDYKYSPGSKQSNMAKRTFKTMESAEEWAQRIASLITSGIEGVDLSEAIRKSSLLLKESPRPEDRTHTRAPSSSITTSSSVSTSPAKHVSPMYVETCQFSASEDYGTASNPVVLQPQTTNIHPDTAFYYEQHLETFVPTEAIPPLDLCSTPTPTMSQANTNRFHLDPPTVTSPFGVGAEGLSAVDLMPWGRAESNNSYLSITPLQAIPTKYEEYDLAEWNSSASSLEMNFDYNAVQYSFDEGFSLTDVTVEFTDPFASDAGSSGVDDLFNPSAAAVDEANFMAQYFDFQ